MLPYNTARIRRESLRIETVEVPGWELAVGRLPQVGEIVRCVEGEAEVVKVLTRLSDGGRLLELRLVSQPKTPFFAASSNVFVRTEPAKG
ncbi:MAG TPA: hypothetical protein VLH75_00400 [Longimicrobiales bacterium]|nr:hypothetical protein [Longimicrobiales bacterium]